MLPPHLSSLFFFFNDSATTEIYPLSLHDALPILKLSVPLTARSEAGRALGGDPLDGQIRQGHFFDTPDLAPNRSGVVEVRSEEHTPELPAPFNPASRPLLEKKKNCQTPPRMLMTT